MSQLVVVSFLSRLFRASSLLKWTLTDEERTFFFFFLPLTSFHYHQHLSRSKLSFMSTARQSLSSVIYQNLIILHTGNATQGLFYFSTASLPLKCELQTSQACCTPPPPPHHHPHPHLPPTRPVLLSFNMFYSFFLSTS